MHPFCVAEVKLSEYRKYPKTEARTIIDYNNILSLVGQKGLYCFDRGLLPIIRGLLASRGLWRTSYSIASDDFGYYIPSDDEFDIVGRTIKEFLAEVDDMSCDITAGLSGIENAIRQLQLTQAAGAGPCGIGAGGSGQYAQPETGFVDNGVDNYPDDFESRSDYDSFKCSVAYLIWQTAKQDLMFIQNLDVTGLTAAALVATLISPIPFDEVAALALVVAQLAIEAALDTVLENIIGYWEDNEEDIICLMYNGANESAVLEGLEDFASDFLTSVEQSFLGFIVTSDAMRWLFSKPALLLPDYDCSGCGAVCYPDFMILGSVVSELVYTSDQNPANGWQYIHGKWNFDGSQYCGTAYDQVSIVVQNDTTNPPNKSILYRLYNQSEQLIYNQHNVPPVNVNGVARFQISVESTTNPLFYSGDFEIVVTRSE